MFSRLPAVALTGLALLSSTYAQTFTSCNPMNKTCPANPALGSNATFDFTTGNADSKIWNMTAGPMTYAEGGATFAIANRGDSPTIQTNFYIFWGSVTVFMKAASGRGIISSIVLESDDLDEVDWEILGGNRTHVQTNYFGKANTSSFDRMIPYEVPVAPQDDYHNYTTHWTQDRLEWWINGELRRTLPYAAANGGKNYPQTPMNIRLGIWAGGDKKMPPGTIDWAGGLTNYNETYTMYVRSVDVHDFSKGKSYTYSDRSGSWQSIKVEAGNSTAIQEIAKPTGMQSLPAKWKSFSHTTRTAILACAIGGAALLLAAIIACCIVQGRKGKREKMIADAKWEKEQAETNEYRMKMMNGAFSQGPQKAYY